ncbi:hypothetical protein N657DRAFT_631859 [Parathielavia appendiculata]|uniref:Uncharacterized protein n=1 Tax=Parathielavia appendiculata TaxID=2587402 RepID=A0AAN6U3P0_9PEZI|nr:hypothetical protein N657DRAFT_631859 [Parathielavia appendiculata]
MSTLQLPARRYSATTVRGGLGPKANCTLEICPVEFSVYGYRPRLPPTSPSLSCIYAAAVHIYLGARWKQWWFTSCMIIGAVNAIIGYIGRVLMYYSPFDFAAFVLQITTQFALQTGRDTTPQIFYYINISYDLFSLIVQAAGGGLSTSTKGQSQTGVNLALVGLAFQV